MHSEEQMRYVLEGRLTLGEVVELGPAEVVDALADAPQELIALDDWVVLSVKPLSGPS